MMSNPIAEKIDEKNPPRKRIQLDFSLEGYNKLVSLTRKFGENRTYVDVVRSALALYDWFVGKRAEGYTLSIEKDGVRKEVEFVGLSLGWSDGKKTPPTPSKPDSE